MPKPKSASSYSLSADGKILLDRLAESLGGIPKNAVLDLALRELAKRHGVTAKIKTVKPA